MRRAARRSMLAMCASGLALSAASAQQATDYYWLSAAFSVGRMDMHLADSSLGSRTVGQVRLGLRICALCIVGVHRLTVTPGVEFTATDLGGLNPGSEPYAFSRADLTARVAQTISIGRASFRPFVGLLLAGARTGEFASATSYSGVVNRRGRSGNRLSSVGFEFVWGQAHRNIELSASSVSGRFSDLDPASEKVAPAPFRARMLTLGYSGPLNGAGVPW